MENQIRRFLTGHILFKDYCNATSLVATTPENSVAENGSGVENTTTTATSNISKSSPKEMTFIDSLISLMKPRLYVDGAYIIKKGEIGRAMFFNLKGFVDVVSEDGENIINVMEEGSFFGEIGVLYSVPRTVSCRSRGKSIMLILTKESLTKALEPYPLIARGIGMIAEQRYASHLKKVESSVTEEFGEELSPLSIISAPDLQNVSFFKDTSIGFLHSLALSLKPEKYQRGQWIFKKGDAASEMFFVAKGMAEVVDEARNVVYAQFKPGSFFGEVGLFNENQSRTASVRCTSEDLLVFKCERSILYEILKEFPEVHANIEREMSSRMEYIRQRGLVSLTTAHQVQATELEAVRQRLASITLFSGADLHFLHSLALHVTIKQYQPGDIIFREDEVANGMYLVIEGSIEIVSKDEKQVYAEVGRDAYFGEVSLFYNINRTATVRCKTHATLLELGRKVVIETLKDYGTLQESIRHEAKIRYDIHLNRSKNDSRNAVALANSEFSMAEKLKQMTIFKNCDNEFLKNLASKVAIRSFNSNQLIFRQGDQAKEIYFVVEGTVNIMAQNMTTVYDTIGGGDFFGEIGVIKGTTRNASACSGNVATVLLSISGEEVKKSLEHFPDSYSAIVLACDERGLKADARKEMFASGESLNHLPGMEDLAPNTQLPTEDVTQKVSVGNVFFQEQDKSENVVAKLKKLKLASSMTGEHDLNLGSEGSSLELFENRNSITSVDFVTEKEPRTHPVINILDANDYELSIILQGVTFIELGGLRRVCRQWNQQLSSGYFCSKISLRRYTSDITNRFLKSMSAFANRSLESINLSGCGKVTDDAISILTKNCPNIRKIDISDCWKLTDHALNHIGQNLILLENLDISHCNKLNGRGFQSHKMTRLKSFNASYCKSFSDKSLEKLFSTTPNVLEVRIRRCTRLTEFGIFLIVRFCRKIELFDIRDMEQASDRCMKWISSACFNLLSINFSFCCNITQAGFIDFSQGFQRYKSLDFTNCTQVNDNTILLLKDCILELKYLCLKNCTKITDAIASHLAIRARRLRRLDLTGCVMVTPAFGRILGAVNKKVTLLMTKSLKERGILLPGYPGKPIAFEIHPNELFTSGPKELMEFGGTLTNELVKTADVNVRKLIKYKTKKLVMKAVGASAGGGKGGNGSSSAGSLEKEKDLITD